MKKKQKPLRQAIFLSLILLTACANKEKQPETPITVSQIEETEEEGEEEKEERKEERAREDMADGSVTDKESQPAGQPKSQIAAADFSRPPEVMLQEAVPAATMASVSQDEKIQHIRNIYNRTVGNQGSYRQSGGCYYTAEGVLAKAVASNGNTALDETMHKNGYTTYSLEYYYEDWADGDRYPVFIYAVIDKKEYRYYFCEGEFIRRVGPEGGGNTNDSPEMNTFIQTLRDVGAYYRNGTMAPVAAETEAARADWSRADKIAYIDSVYNGGGSHTQKIVLSTGNPVLDEAMKKNGYSDYLLECYYDESIGTGSGCDTAMLIHAWIDGKQYWYYFYNDEYICRIGPEGGGNRNDTPQLNSFIQTLHDECARNCYF